MQFNDGGIDPMTHTEIFNESVEVLAQFIVFVKR